MVLKLALFGFKGKNSEMSLRELNEVIMEQCDRKEAVSASEQVKLAYHDSLRPPYGCPYGRKCQTEELVGRLTPVSWSITTR